MTVETDHKTEIYSSESRPLVSFVVPAYNAAKTLRNCLDSILRQTESRIEVVCVNDGSYDGTLQIMQEYASRDLRVRILNQVNQGVSFARNNGVKETCGLYVCFVDSDDEIDPRLVEKTLARSNSQTADLVFFAINSKFVSVLSKCKDFYSDPTTEERNFFLGNLSGSSCEKVWRREFFLENSLFFPPEIRVTEGLTISVKALALAKSWGVCAEQYYFYKDNGASVTRTIVSGKEQRKCLDLFNVHRTMKRNLADMGRLDMLDGFFQQIMRYEYYFYFLARSRQLRRLWKQEANKIFSEEELLFLQKKTLSLRMNRFYQRFYGSCYQKFESYCWGVLERVIRTTKQIRDSLKKKF